MRRKPRPRLRLQAQLWLLVADVLLLAGCWLLLAALAGCWLLLQLLLLLLLLLLAAGC